jgi:hypothetical protein
MLIELRNIHARWQLLIENTCMLQANGNETMWTRTGFRVHRRVTNKGKTNYMEGIVGVKLNGQETETTKSVMPRTDLVTVLTGSGYVTRAHDADHNSFSYGV